ncbi:universal stress protein [Natronobacterium gregoryi]|uniref:Universal stress protein n=2 Tax=Natronobacterium gregoryi TaxID=44930 RepID=L0AF62_NATGS|nr:universal stress protein [Natronobacterium gregoryi]AFZ71685.1 universal stress protein UspA-like protein [Natronobacterium gregoryi SP2]ELY72743.1 UspA domain-containing protein [Natronobacterium gregoryi SP2]PLK20267.1 universal stress protein [Natronobacterium gregoryi SP2]SFJ25125.1 Nucleotide-binding universal stress protein, UspA family [Natronobacterium gregoryi]
MARSILVAHDDSSHAQAALEYALETFPDARIVLFHAIDPFAVTADESELPPLTESWLEEQRADAAELFEEAREAVVDEDVTIETDTAVGSPPQTILGYVEDSEIDQIVLGGRGRSAGPSSEFRLGSTAELVVRRANVPVIVVR